MERVLDAHDAACMPAFDFEARYTAEEAGYSDGIAWRVFGWEAVADEDTEWTGIYVSTGKVLAHMVGDDRTFAFDPDDLTKLDTGAYCLDCGQVGCGWHVEEEE